MDGLLLIRGQNSLLRHAYVAIICARKQRRKYGKRRRVLLLATITSGLTFSSLVRCRGCFRSLPSYRLEKWDQPFSLQSEERPVNSFDVHVIYWSLFGHCPSIQGIPVCKVSFYPFFKNHPTISSVHYCTMSN